MKVGIDLSSTNTGLVILSDDNKLIFHGNFQLWDKSSQKPNRVFVRELFDKMFNVNGGEVKVTQASHDGGVDAIAFDDDPIRGGKFVIQETTTATERAYNIVVVGDVKYAKGIYSDFLNNQKTLR